MSVVDTLGFVGGAWEARDWACDLPFLFKYPRKLEEVGRAGQFQIWGYLSLGWVGWADTEAVHPGVGWVGLTVRLFTLSWVGWADNEAVHPGLGGLD